MDSWFPTFRRVASSFGGLANFRIEWRLPSWWPLRSTWVQRRTLLRLIAVGIEEKLPLGPLLAQWAEDERGVQRSRVLHLVRLLNGGLSLPDALEEVPGVLRDEDVLAIRFDAQSGTRTAAIRQMLEEPPLSAAAPIVQVRQTIAYFCVVLPIGLVLVTFYQLKIVPVILRMVQEFGIRQPAAMDWSIYLGRLFAAYWWVGVLAVLALVWSMFSTRAGRFVRYSIVNRLVRPLRDLRTAEVLETLGVAMSAGRPLPGALSTLARYHFDPAVRHQLLFVRNEVEQGEDIWRSLASIGMLAPADLHLLTAAERVGNRPWALAQLVGVKKRRTLWRLGCASELLLPLLVLLLGAFVLLQALTVFTPLVQLIKGLV
jgi:type IV pilus assembly protein PilC